MTPANHDDQLVRLASDDARVYENARRWFMDRGASIAPVLINGLEDRSLGSVGQWRILLLLRELALPSTLPAILKAFHLALDEKDPIVLPGAMEALAVFDPGEATSALTSVLGSGDADFVNHAAALLGKIGGRRAEASLTALLDHQDARFRQSGVRGLLAIDTDSARERLRQQRAGEKDPGVLKLLGTLK